MATAITLPTGLPFTDLENSPLFHATLNELQGNVQSFKDQTERLIKGARTYNASLDASHDAMVAFAQCVESFAGGTIAAKGEEPSAGSAFLLKFSSALKELASFQELLRAQIDVIVCEQLSHKWSRKVSEMKESRKLADRRSAEYNAARSKLVGNKDASRSAVELSTSRSLAEEARLQLASGLMAADGERSFALVEALAGVAEAHVRCCKQAAGVAERLEARRGRAEAWLGRQKEAAVARDAALAAWVEQHRDVERARDMAATGMSVQGCQNLAAQAQGSVKAPAGPAQMSVSSALMMAELETYIRATRESQGAEITILKQGYLLKQSSYFRREWRRRFFVLDSQGMFYYYSEKEKSGKDMQAKNTVNLLTSTVKPGAEDTTLPCCFRVIGATQKEYTLQAESESEQQEWIDAIQSVIMCLLHGPTSSELPQEQRPQRPTHSRSMSSSAAEVLSLFSQSLAGDPGLGPLAASLVTHSPASSAQPSPCPGRSTPQGGLSVGWSMGPGGVLPKVLLLEEMENDDESSDERDLREPALSALGASSTARHARQSTTTTTDSSFLELAGGAEAGTVADAALPALTLTSLRALPGNEACADCGAPAPSWASINLGVLLCIACSGPHRSLGVHVSKIRSLDLDVKVWDAGTLGLGCSLGNAFANGVWERGLANAPGHARPAATETDPRVRQAFIAAKYEARAFMGEPRWEARVAQRALERAVGEGDVKAAYVALAWGAEADPPAGDAVLGEPAAERLRRGLCPGAQAGGAEGTGDEGEERESVTLLHVAAGTGGALLVELLVQWGAAPDACDSKLATPLVYALACDEPLVAHFLLARGAGAQALPAPPHLGGQSPLAAAASSHLALALSQPRCRQDAALIEALRTT